MRGDKFSFIGKPEKKRGMNDALRIVSKGENVVFWAVVFMILWLGTKKDECFLTSLG